MTDNMHPELEPDQQLSLRIDELGRAQARVSDAIARLPLLNLTRENLQYQHEAGVLNHNFVTQFTDELADTKTDMAFGRLYERDEYYERYTKQITVECRAPEAVTALKLRSNILWYEMGFDELQPIMPSVTRMERAATDEFGKEQPDIKVKSSYGLAPYDSPRVTVPFFIIGDRPRDGSITELLLAMPSLESEKLKILGGVYVSAINTVKLAQLRAEAEALIPSPQDVQETYNAASDTFKVTPDVSHSHIAKVNRRMPLFAASREFVPLDTSRKLHKVAKRPIEIEIPKRLGNTLEPDVFDTFKVLDRTIDLAGLFGKTALLNELLAKRSAAMPVNPLDRMVGITDRTNFIETAEASEALECGIDKLADRGRDI